MALGSLGGVPDRLKSSEELIREAKESLSRPPTERPPEPVRTEPHPKPTMPTQTKGSDEASAVIPRPRSPRQAAPAAQPAAPDVRPARTGLWKLIAFISLGWVALVTASIVSSIFTQPDDAFELALGGVVITLIPLLIGIYAVRRARQGTNAPEGGGPA